MTEQRTAPESSAGKLSDETVAEIVERILGVCLPERVILFGSAATARMTRDSDIDILVVQNTVADADGQLLRAGQHGIRNAIQFFIDQAHDGRRARRAGRHAFG